MAAGRAGSAFLLAAAALALAGLAFGRGGLAGRVIGVFALAALIGCALIWIAAGLVLTLAARPADLFVTNDGRHLAVRAEDGQVALLRERAGDYVRDTLSELSGREGYEAIALDDLPDARCGPDSCTATLIRGNPPWHLLATRSPYRIDRAAMEPASGAADIVASDRRLPDWCRPHWLKADATLLARTGGLAIRLAPSDVATMAGRQGAHPWAGDHVAPPRAWNRMYRGRKGWGSRYRCPAAHAPDADR